MGLVCFGKIISFPSVFLSSSSSSSLSTFPELHRTDKYLKTHVEFEKQTQK